MVSVGETQAPCVVTAQEGNRLWILIESAEQLSPVIPSARLVLAQTDLLKRLKETLLDLDSFGLAPKVFGLRVSDQAYESAAARASPISPQYQSGTSGSPESVVGALRLSWQDPTV